jgi:hypothetical protein
MKSNFRLYGPRFRILGTDKIGRFAGCVETGHILGDYKVTLSFLGDVKAVFKMGDLEELPDDGEVSAL